MPPLRRPPDQAPLMLPPRQAQVAAETEVLVVGGGPAGIGAALGAARAGAQVVLVERYGFLGGNATAALVMPWMSAHTRHPRPPRPGELGLMPQDHGIGGELVVRGVWSEIIDGMVQAAAALPPGPETGYTVPFDPEAFKTFALDLLDQSGVTYLLHAFASGVIEPAGPDGVVFETKSGPQVVRAQVVIDATGDGDVAAAAGAPYEIGREDGLTQPMSLMFRMVDVERRLFADYVRRHPDQWRGVHGLWDLVQRASEAGELDLPREDILMFGTTHPSEVAVNSTRVTRVLGVDVFDLTRAEVISHRQARQIAEFLRSRVPGFADAYLAQTGVGVGVRETRRVLGAYVLTGDDVLSAAAFDDVIARGTYPIDIHNPTGRGSTLRDLPPGAAYEIPLRCLLPRGVDRLLVAGRCISGTHEAHSSYRVTPTAVATGHAAGVTAGLATSHQLLPREVPIADVQAELLRQGADLHRVRAA